MVLLIRRSWSGSSVTLIKSSRSLISSSASFTGRWLNSFKLSNPLTSDLISSFSSEASSLITIGDPQIQTNKSVEYNLRNCHEGKWLSGDVMANDSCGAGCVITSSTPNNHQYDKLPGPSNAQFQYVPIFNPCPKFPSLCSLSPLYPWKLDIISKGRLQILLCGFCP